MRLLLLGLLVLAIPAQACQVTPMLVVEIPQEAPCIRGFQAQDECDKVPAPGAPVRLEGVVRWSWDVDECTAESGFVQDDVTITFSGSSANPQWMPLSFEPEQLVIPAHEYYDPLSVRVDPATGRLYSEKEQAVTVTVDFLRAPVAEERERLQNRDGIAVTFVKAHAAGDGARESFAVSQLSFDGRHLLAKSYPTAERVYDESTPAPPVAVLLGLLVLLSRASAGTRRR